jgi:hypothetical protein
MGRDYRPAGNGCPILRSAGPGKPQACRTGRGGLVVALGVVLGGLGMLDVLGMAGLLGVVAMGGGFSDAAAEGEGQGQGEQ